MGKRFDEITAELREWIERQPMFFVATAPLASDGLVNCSPKGLDSFRVLGPRTVAYLDLTGSGVETIAHARENGRICLMFCAFSGAPRIVRLHGTADVVVPSSSEWAELAPRFTPMPGARAIVRASLSRIGDSCGYAVPRLEHTGERDTLLRWAESKGEDGLRTYRREHNARSLDGLPGVRPD